MENEFLPEMNAENEENVWCGSGKALNNIHEGFQGLQVNLFAGWISATPNEQHNSA